MKMRLSGCLVEEFEVDELLVEEEERKQWDQLVTELGLSRPSRWGAAELQILAEAVNWGAKVFTPWFYSWKPEVVVSAVEAGAGYGWGSDDAFYLCTMQGGVCCFHDPGADIWHLLQNRVQDFARVWPYQWSGVSRQEISFDLWKSLLGDRVLITEVVEATLPKDELIVSTEPEEIPAPKPGLATPFENL